MFRLPEHFRSNARGFVLLKGVPSLSTGYSPTTVAASSAISMHYANMARREFISIEGGELHAERSLIFARVEKLLLIPHKIKQISDDTHPKALPEMTTKSFMSHVT